jgi:hypothetical protein
MAQREIPQPIKIYRGTVDEVFSHRSEIPADAIVELKIFDKEPLPAEETPTMAPMRTGPDKDMTDDPEEIKEAERELLEFKRNMNRWRREAGARMPYPEAE